MFLCSKSYTFFTAERRVGFMPHSFYFIKIYLCTLKMQLRSFKRSKLVLIDYAWMLIYYKEIKQNVVTYFGTHQQISLFTCQSIEILIIFNFGKAVKKQNFKIKAENSISVSTLFCKKNFWYFLTDGEPPFFKINGSLNYNAASMASCNFLKLLFHKVGIFFLALHCKYFRARNTTFYHAPFSTSLFLRKI